MRGAPFVVKRPPLGRAPAGRGLAARAAIDRDVETRPGPERLPQGFVQILVPALDDDIEAPHRCAEYRRVGGKLQRARVLLGIARDIDRTAMEEHTDDPVEELAKCKESNEELREENSHLRQAAGVFGELAERLNTVLREDRRQHLQPDRRAVARAGSDRRSEVYHPPEPVEQ